LPPSATLRLNMRVEVAYGGKNSGEPAWFPGTVAALRKGTNEADVLLVADGTVETDLPSDDRSKVRPLSADAARLLFPAGTSDAENRETARQDREAGEPAQAMARAPPPPQTRQAQTQQVAVAAPAAAEEAMEVEDEADTELPADAAEKAEEAQRRLCDAANALGMAVAAFEAKARAVNVALFDGRPDEAARLEEELRAELRGIADEEARQRAAALLRALEEERRRAHEAWLAAEAAAEAERQRREQAEANALKREEMRQKEAARQQWLRCNGQCCMGYRWMHRGGGLYQCAGGSHWERMPGHLM
jgi:hypothetical protein